jgi:peptidyl-prolyl cis-trans isomerase SurA
MRKSVKKIRLLTATLLATLLLSPAIAAPQIQEADRIVAVVGNEVITFRDLSERLRTAVNQLKKQGTALPSNEILQKQLLERMIIDRVQTQLAREMGMEIDDAQLDQAIARIAAGNRLSLDQFKDALKKDGLEFKRFREEIRSEMMIGRLREREVDNRVTVSEPEVDLWLANQQASTMQGTEYAIAHILLRIPEGANPTQVSQIKTRAEQALAKARKGTDFAELAASYSDAPDALQGGILGWRPLNGMPSLFAEVVPSIAAGNTSDVLRSANGFHIVKVLNKRGGESSRFAPIRQTHARHILIRADQLVSETDARHKLETVRERLLHGADFAEQARLYSQDGSGSKGGDLGWLYQGDTVPDFEKAMDALKINEISSVIRSPFGFHLIQVQERRMQDVSEERRRVVAKQAIRERKAEESYQDWLRQIRDRAYVEYRLEEQ